VYFSEMRSMATVLDPDEHGHAVGRAVGHEGRHVRQGSPLQELADTGFEWWHARTVAKQVP